MPLEDARNFLTQKNVLTSERIRKLWFLHAWEAQHER